MGLVYALLASSFTPPAREIHVKAQWRILNARKKTRANVEIQMEAAFKGPYIISIKRFCLNNFKERN